jgi:DnaJ-domain-containing protein 1
VSPTRAADPDALRGIDRWGTGEMVDAAFRGFAALPPGDSNAIYVQPSQAWHEVLEVSPTASQDVIRAAYRSKAAKAHPDSGGSDAEFSRIQKAYEEAQR